MRSKTYWEEKLVKHFGDRPFTTDQAIPIVDGRGNWGYSTVKMAGKLRCSKRFKSIGMKDKIYGYKIKRKSVNLWQVN